MKHISPTPANFNRPKEQQKAALNGKSLTRRVVRGLVLMGSGLGLLGMATAAEPGVAGPRAMARELMSEPAGERSSLEAWWQGEGMGGEWMGARGWLGERGVQPFAGWTMDVFGNTAGGIKRGAVFSGLLDFGIELDLETLVGWPGATVSTTWGWLSGRDASEDLAGNFLTVSNIAGFNTLRMLELWLEQRVLEGALGVRAGQLTADSEFLVSDYGALFLNGTFGWPALAYMNLPEGGPGYPMGTLGARVAVQPAGWLTLLAGVYQGNVFGQDVNRHGFRWRLGGREGFTFLNEAQVRWNQEEAGGRGLPGQVKAGFWMQTGRFADALAESTASGNGGFYFVVDQMLWRGGRAGSATGPVGTGKAVAAGKQQGGGKSPAGYAGPAERPAGTEGPSVGWFGRVGFAPEERNAVSFYLDTGLVGQGLVPGRPDDQIGVGLGLAQTSPGWRQGLVEEGAEPAGIEMVLECTCRIAVNRWLAVQPDVQAVFFPNASRSVSNALLVGFRVEAGF